MRRKLRLRHPVGFVLAAVAAVAATMFFVAGAGAVVAGAGFTTNDPNIDGLGTCLNGNSDPNPAVNCNLYGSKNFVWINGGPSNGKNALSAGTYFFAVLDPGGQKDPNDGTDGNLSDVSPTSNTGAGDAYTAREFTVDSTGKIATYLGGGHSTDSNYVASGNGLFINLMPYDDTTNPGGVYIMAVCQLSGDQATSPIEGTVDPSACKYDAFKAPTSACDPAVCTPDKFGVVSGEKYYDANMNGQLDPLEVGIANWAIDYTDGLSGTILTGSDGTFSDSFVADTYTFTEEQATNTTGPPFNLPEWIQTGNTVDQTQNTGLDTSSLSNFIYSIGVFDGGTTSGINFGNVCLGGNGGGLTLGFWSNKNGQALETAADFTLLTSLNLRNANGSNRDFTDTLAKNKTALNSWLLSANAVNMANMLSAQLAAMELNVQHNKVDGNSMIYVGGTINAFMTVNAVMALANASLGTDPITVASSATRSYQEMLKSALDAANNNVNFVQPNPTKCPAPTFP